MFLESKVFHNLASEVLKKINVSCAYIGLPMAYIGSHKVNLNSLMKWSTEAMRIGDRDHLGSILESGYHISMAFLPLSFISPSFYPSHQPPHLWYGLYIVEFGKMYAVM